MQVNSNLFPIEDLPDELLAPILGECLEECPAITLSSVSRRWHSIILGECLRPLYKKMVQFHFPEVAFAQKGCYLDKVYNLSPILSDGEKVCKIFNRFFCLAKSFSPSEFKLENHRNACFILSNYTSYALNINRLILWCKLPGGEQYLEQENIKKLPLAEKGNLLQGWIAANFQIVMTLKELDLNNSGLTFLPPEIGQLSQLEQINATGNKLTTLPAELGQLSKLEYLYLNHNQLRALPKVLGQLHSLKWLYLCNNQLRALPAELGQLHKLQWLCLSYNQLRDLPAELGQLSKLQGLYLNDNQLTALPTELGQLPSLERLELRLNQLTALPAELGQLHSLKWLCLNYNQLRALPESLGQLCKLQELDLHHNQLIALPESLGQLPSLKQLKVSKNQLRVLPKELLSWMWWPDGGDRLRGSPAELTLPSSPQAVENEVTDFPTERTRPSSQPVSRYKDFRKFSLIYYPLSCFKTLWKIIVDLGHMLKKKFTSCRLWLKSVKALKSCEVPETYKPAIRRVRA